MYDGYLDRAINAKEKFISLKELVNMFPGSDARTLAKEFRLIPVWKSNREAEKFICYECPLCGNSSDKNGDLWKYQFIGQKTCSDCLED